MSFKGFIKSVAAVAYKNRAVIETVAGMTLVVGGTAVVISKAKKAAEISKDLEYLNNDIHKMVECEADKKEISKAKKEMVKYAACEYTKCYWLGIGLEIAGLCLIGVSDVTMSKELTAVNGLLAGYAATLSNIKERVIADQGEEKWNEYYYGPQKTNVEVLPDGTVLQTTAPVDNNNRPANLPPFSYIFDLANNPNCEKSAIQNRDFIEDHLRWLNDKLDKEEFLFLNEILKDFGFERVKCGYTAGIKKWSIDPVTGEKVRNYLKCGIEANTEAMQRFRDGIEPYCILTFNVEPNIIDDLGLALI